VTPEELRYYLLGVMLGWVSVLGLIVIGMVVATLRRIHGAGGR